MEMNAVRHRFPVLLFALVALLLLGPWLQVLRAGRAFTVVVGAFIPIVALYAVGGNRRHVVLAWCLALPAIVANLAWFVTDGATAANASAAIPLAFFVYTTVALSRYVFSSEEATTDTLAAAACIYLLLGIVWWLAYASLEAFFPGSFAGLGAPGEEHRSTLLYFSYVTLTTLGYGEIVPVTPPARSLAAVEAVAGTLFLAILIARLVGLHGRRRPS